MNYQDITPIDEIQWSSPQRAHDMGGIHTNTVLHYFHESPFFDRMSNNAFLAQQAFNRPDMLQYVATRKAFEEWLNDSQGSEFRVVQDPSDNDRIPTHQHTGVWVIRKQNRIKDRQSGDPDKIEPLNTYFVIGENVYMAPTLGNILKSRTLSMSRSLSKFFDSACSLPVFKPACGQVYDLPSAKGDPVGSSTLNTRQNSKENTPLPETQVASLSPNLKAAGDDATTELDPKATALLSETMSNNARYAGKFMDDQPLIGEPGSFKLQESQDLQVPIEKQRTGAERRTTPVPPPLKTDLANEADKKN